MTKKDYIRVGIMIHLLVNPEGRTPKEAGIWAADIWDMTESTDVAVVPRRKTNKKKSFLALLEKTNAQWFEYYNQFWSAGRWTELGGKDNAAKAWLEMCKRDNPTTEQFKHIIYAAGLELKKRANLIANGQTPMMPQGWLNNFRYKDYEPISALKSKAQNDFSNEQIQDLKGQIQHAKTQQKNDTTDYWKGEEKRLNNQLRKLSKQVIND